MVWKKYEKKHILETYKQFESQGYVGQWYAISSEILLTTFGPDWWKKNYVDDSNNNFFLSKREASTENRFKHQDRVIYLGHLVYSLRNCEGVDYYFESLKTKDLKSCYWELRVANVFLNSEYKVKFVKESGEKKSDFDFVVQKENYIFYVEAKSRDNFNPKNENTLRNTLNEARKQLPKQANGIIYISIPLEWIHMENAEDKISTVIRKFLHETRRVCYVVLEWDDWIKVDSGRLKIAKLLIYDNVNIASSVSLL